MESLIEDGRVPSGLKAFNSTMTSFASGSRMSTSARTLECSEINVCSCSALTPSARSAPAIRRPIAVGSDVTVGYQFLALSARSDSSRSRSGAYTAGFHLSVTIEKKWESWNRLR